MTPIRKEEDLLWRIDPFLGNERETNHKTTDSSQTTVELQQKRKCWKRCVLLGSCKRGYITRTSVELQSVESQFVKR
jgi:hypothetical protein